MPPGFTPPLHKQRSNVALLITCISLALATITVGAFGAVYLLHNNSSANTHTSTIRHLSPTSVATPTQIPSPSPTPSPTPLPTLTMTPAHDPGFTWCDTT